MAWSARIVNVQTFTDRFDVTFEVRDDDDKVVDTHLQGFPLVPSMEEYEGSATVFDPETNEASEVTTTYRRETGEWEWTDEATVREALANYVHVVQAQAVPPVQPNDQFEV